MLSPYVRALMKETGKSESEIISLWNKAKIVTMDTFGKIENAFGKREYRYTKDVVKNMLGFNEQQIKPIDFLNFKGSTDEFFEVVVSGDFSVLNSVDITSNKKKVVQLDKEMDKPTEELLDEEDSLEFEYEQYGDDDSDQKYEFEQYEEIDRDWDIGQDKFKQRHEKRMEEEEGTDVDRERLAREKELDKEQADYDKEKDKERKDSDKEKEKDQDKKDKNDDKDDSSAEKEKEREIKQKDKDKEKSAREKEKADDMEKKKKANIKKSATSVNK